MTKRILLIDGDVIAYQCSAKLETAVEWEPGHWTWHVNFHEVCNAVMDGIEQYVEELEATDYRICLTDPEYNFRKDVLPTYKTHRATVKKPLVLLAVKDWLIENQDAIMKPGLEGDDVMGILATYPSKGEKIIVSIDKDMKTIPCTYVRDLNSEPVVITEEQAAWFHMYQTLMGDATDGYSGCPGIGPTAAKKALDEMIRLEPYEHTLIRGPRKGLTETRYREAEAESMWDVVVSHYAAAGLGEEEALRQARVARILHASDYDFKRKEPILWTP